MSGITIHPNHVSIRAKLMSRAEVDWAIQTLTATRESLFPVTRRYDVVFLSHGPEHKIHAIKEIRTLTGLGLTEAKNISERPGSTILSDVEQPVAMKAVQAMIAASAVVEMRARA